MDCIQCGLPDDSDRAPMGGVVVAVICTNCGEVHTGFIHLGLCTQDNLRDEPRQATLNRLAGIARLN